VVNGLFPFINLTGGSITFADLTSGQINGTLTGPNNTLRIAPSGSRNASMGVYKFRMIGDFSLTTANGPDTGWLIFHRVFKKE
jgi:hypothetical protein